MTERELFEVDHAHEAMFLDAVDDEVSQLMTRRAGAVAANPTDYHLHILGLVPTDPEHRAAWLRGAPFSSATASVLDLFG
jgi:hypothetical protein